MDIATTKYTWQLSTSHFTSRPKKAHRGDPLPKIQRSMHITFRVVDLKIWGERKGGLGISRLGTGPAVQEQLAMSTVKLVHEALRALHEAKNAGYGVHSGNIKGYPDYVNAICGRLDFPVDTTLKEARKVEGLIREVVAKTVVAQGQPWHSENLT